MRRTILKVGVCLVLAVVFTFTMVEAAGASTLSHGGQHGCSGTNPSLIVSDVNAKVQYTPGRLAFTSVHSAKGGWNDTYLIAGYNREINSYMLCGVHGKKYGYRLPFSAAAPVSVTSSMDYSFTGWQGGAIGWDIWLVRNGEEYRETSSRAMQSDHRTMEMMVIPYPYNRVRTVNGLWHRVYIGGGDMKNVDLAELMRTAMRAAGTNPADYQWEAIGGGAEYVHGTFTLNRYALNITTSVTERRGAAATATYTARDGKYSVRVVKRVAVYVTRTATAGVQGHSLASVRGVLASRAANVALANARALAPRAALEAAHRAATTTLYYELHPDQVLPNVVHRQLGSALKILHNHGFSHLNPPRGIPANSIVTYENGHPGRVTPVKDLIVLHAKR